MLQVRFVSAVVRLLDAAITETSKTAEIQIDNTPVVSKVAVLPMSCPGIPRQLVILQTFIYSFFHHFLNLRRKMTQLDKLKGVHLQRVCVRYYQETWKCCLQWLFVHTEKGDIFPVLLSCVCWSIKSCVGDLNVLWLIAEPEYIDPITLRWCLALPRAPKKVHSKVLNPRATR